ncbi:MULTISPECIES: sensor histidine kinase [Streptomyces]|nr:MULTISPECIES: histidine kinase [Streptomyces]OFA52926.1 hypothetical protein BEN35_10575 [Streptomyces fradiae]
MFGRVFGARGRWGKRSRLAQVDLYTRGSLYVMVWLIPPYTLFLLAATASRGLGGAVENGAAVLLALVAPAQAVSAVRLLRRGIDQYRGLGTVPRGETVAGAALMTAALVPVAVLAAGDALGDDGLPVLLASLTVIPFLAPYALLAPLRTVVLVEAGWVAAVLAGFAAAGADRPLLAGTALGLVFSCSWSAFTVRCSAWMLAVMYELEESRTVQARLAVAEERLRFARDMHDVMGRNLAVIALKSELAAQLTRRGSAAAVDQMVEVQRIAQESQREVREVVRGYREADLHTELVGAGAVLRSAGIDCRIDDRHPGGLSPEARSALGWVVREGTTNVLRHAEARHCAIRVRPGRAPDGGRTTVLVMENDGVPDGGPGGPPRPDGGGPGTVPGANGGAGSGLAGLRQRLAEAGGTVTAGPLAGCGFRLTAEVPDGVTAPGGPETGAAAGTGTGADTEAGVRSVDGESSGRPPAGTGPGRTWSFRLRADRRRPRWDGRGTEGTR